jgi:hypothetical protein
VGLAPHQHPGLAVRDFLLFAMMFKWLPDAESIGMTSGSARHHSRIFEIGKAAIGFISVSKAWSRPTVPPPQSSLY